MSKRIYLPMVFLASGMFTISAQAPPAPGFGPRPGMPAMAGMPGPIPPELMEELDLTKAQRTSIRGILEKNRAAHQAGHQAILAKERALMDAVEDPATKEEQIRTLNASLSEARLQAILAHRAVMAEIQAVLTPEQRAKAKEFREQMKKEMESRHAGKERPDERPEGPDGPPPLPR